MDLSNKIDDPILIDLLRQVDKVTSELGIQFFVVGAIARDLILWHGFGIPPGRETRDVDLGVRVSSWDEYELLKDKLTATGKFKAVGGKQRLLFDKVMSLDILPFGAIVNSEDKIKWPPREDTELNLLGFEDAYENSISMKISTEPDLELKASSATGLVLLKIFAWDDRRPNTKDAIDLGILIRSYLRIGNDSRLWEEHADLLDKDDFDYAVAGAQILGRDLASICPEDTRKKILEILDRELNDGDLPLVVESAESSPQIDMTLEFWKAIRNEINRTL